MMYDTVSFSYDSVMGLQKVTWTFWLYAGDTLVLQSYVVEERPSRRHGFRETIAYYRQEPTHRPNKLMPEADVPLTQEISERAIREFTSKLRVKRWSQLQR